MEKILFVDDEAVNLLLFEINFSNEYEVFTAQSGLDGINVLGLHPDIKIVFSDMKMPGMTGVEFIKNAKNKYPSVRYYVITGYDLTSEIQLAQGEGLIEKCFTKPYKIEEVDSEINKVLNQKN